MLFSNPVKKSPQDNFFRRPYNFLVHQEDALSRIKCNRRVTGSAIWKVTEIT